MPLILCFPKNHKDQRHKVSVPADWEFIKRQKYFSKMSSGNETTSSQYTEQRDATASLMDCGTQSRSVALGWRVASYEPIVIRAQHMAITIRKSQVSLSGVGDSQTPGQPKIHIQQGNQHIKHISSSSDCSSGI